MTYFAIAAIIGAKLENSPAAGRSIAVAFTVFSLLTIIFFSEMLPKSVAVLRARSLAGVIGVPLAAAVRLIDPLMPALRVVTELSRRLLWPTLAQEDALELGLPRSRGEHGDGRETTNNTNRTNRGHEQSRTGVQNQLHLLGGRPCVGELQHVAGRRFPGIFLLLKLHLRNPVRAHFAADP